MGVNRYLWFGLLISVVSGCTITGNVALDNTAPEIILGDVQVLGTTVTINWQTDEPTRSTFQLGHDTQVFAMSTDFSAVVDNLAEDEEYEYVITSCDSNDNCRREERSIITASGGIKITPLTARAVDSTAAVEGMQSMVSAILIALASMIVGAGLVQAGRTVMKKRPSRGVEGHIKNGEKLVQEGQHGEAANHYLKAREEYIKLNKDQQIKQYEGLMSLYTALAQRREQEEAHSLADKFTEGNITRDEIARLRNLLSK